MAEWDRERQGRQSENDNDWDWYYYEYRYEPYPSGDRERYGRNYGQNFNRGSSQDYGRNYGRGYGQNYGQGYNQDYGQNYGRSYGQNYGPGYNQQYGRNYGQGKDYQNDYGSSGSMSNWNRGRYSGVGPRGYRRSDDRLTEDINDRLTWHGQVDATEIQVDVKDGIATLSGTVHSRYEKRMAEEIAESIPGVKDIQNNLKINNQSNWNQGGNETETNQQTQGETTETSRKRR